MTGVSEDKNKDDIERPSSVNMSSYSGDCRARRNSVLNEFLVKAYAKQIRERNTNTGTSPTVQYRKIHMRVLNRPATVSCMFMPERGRLHAWPPVCFDTSRSKDQTR
jgi:hypothetical protein